MPQPKREGTPISFRLPPDVAEELERFVEDEDDWTKVEAVAVALHAFLKRSRAERLQDLLAFRGRKHGADDEGGKRPPKK